jgi:hypothetical protein
MALVAGSFLPVGWKELNYRQMFQNPSYFKVTFPTNVTARSCYMSMLHVRAPCTCHVYLHNWHAEFYILHVHAACPNCSPGCMSILLVHAECPCFHTEYPCCISPPALALLHVHPDCPCCMSMQHVLYMDHVHALCPWLCLGLQAACPCCVSLICPRCMSLLPAYASRLHVHAMCPCCISVLYVYVTCHCCLSILRSCAAFPCLHAVYLCCISTPSFMSTKHVLAACLRCMSMLHVPATFPCGMSLLHVHVHDHASCPTACSHCLSIIQLQFAC